MKRLFISAALLFGIMIHLDVYAGSSPLKTGNQLLSVCKKGIALMDGIALSESDQHEAVECAIYVQGFRDGHLATAAYKAMMRKDNKDITLSDISAQQIFCDPDEATVGQMTRIVVRYLESHPDTLHGSSGILVMRALKAAFPCRQSH